VNMEFTIPGDPKPKGRPRASVNKHTGRVQVRTPDKTREAEQTLAARAMEFRPPEPLTGPLHVDVIFVLPVPKSWSKWKHEAAEAGHYFHTSKPDRDNLVKLFKDALNGLFWLDDSQICMGFTQKVYGAQPRTWVRVRELEQMTAARWKELKAEQAA
jgi:Holliday junction resolvase RusA-like endonuclease